eukprot:3671731-Rhodomonas_salina.1
MQPATSRKVRQLTPIVPCSLLPTSSHMALKYWHRSLQSTYTCFHPSHTVGQSTYTRFHTLLTVGQSKYTRFHPLHTVGTGSKGLGSGVDRSRV